MRWPDVIEAVAVAASLDPGLVAIYGANIRLKGSQEHRVPSLDYLLISDTETELWEPIVVQWDQYAPTMDDLIASERILRSLFSHELAVSIGSVSLFCEFIDGVALDAPTRDNCYARAVRFSFEAIRSALLRS